MNKKTWKWFGVKRKTKGTKYFGEKHCAKRVQKRKYNKKQSSLFVVEMTHTHMLLLEIVSKWYYTTAQILT